MNRPSLAASLALTFLSLATAGCQATLPAGNTVGEVMQTQKVLALAVVDSTPTDYFDQTLLVEATAIAVCVNSGCWMQVEDGEHTAMVRWEEGCGGLYAFPEDIVGRRVLIQGSFYPKVISAEDAEHISGEASGDIEVPLAGYEFNATSILIPSE